MKTGSETLDALPVDFGSSTHSAIMETSDLSKLEGLDVCIGAGIKALVGVEASYYGLFKDSCVFVLGAGISLSAEAQITAGLSIGFDLREITNTSEGIAAKQKICQQHKSLPTRWFWRAPT